MYTHKYGHYPQPYNTVNLLNYQIGQAFLQNRNISWDGHQQPQSNGHPMSALRSHTQPNQSNQNGEQNYHIEWNRSSHAGLDNGYCVFQPDNAGNTLYLNEQTHLQNRNFMDDRRQPSQSNGHPMPPLPFQTHWHLSTQNGQQNYYVESNRASHAGLDSGRYGCHVFQPYNAENTLYLDAPTDLQNRNFMANGQQSLQLKRHSVTAVPSYSQSNQSTQNGHQNTESNRVSHADSDNGHYEYRGLQPYNTEKTLFLNRQTYLQNRIFMDDRRQPSNDHPMPVLPSKTQRYLSTQNEQQNYYIEANRASHGDLDIGHYDHELQCNAVNTSLQMNIQASDAVVSESTPSGSMIQNRVEINERNDKSVADDTFTSESADIDVTNDQSLHTEIEDKLIEHIDSDRNANTAYNGYVNVKPKHEVGCDNTNMFVRYSDDQTPKKLCCPFCDKLQTKLPRHMESKHKNEIDVQRFMNLPKGSPERRAIIDALRKIGCDNWNRNAEINNNELIPSRRPNRKYSNSAVGFTTCPHCRGSFTKLGLRFHASNKCLMKPVVSDIIRKNERSLTALATSVEARHHKKASKALKNVFTNFRNDPLVRSFKFDWLMIAYGNKMSAEYPQRKNKGMIRGHLRLVGRFLRELKRLVPEISDLASAYHPMYFDRIIEAIQNVARFDADNGEYGAPGTATKCVTVIKKMGSVLISEYIKQDNSEKQRVTQNIMTLMNTDIHGMINKTAVRNQNQRKRLKKVNLPTMDDVKTLAQFLESESSKCYNELVKSFDYKVWLQLSKLTLGSIIIFNRKRVGDAENILVEEFERRELVNEETNELLFSSLSEESKQIAKRYSRMIVGGKKDRDVPVLLNSFMERNIELLIAQRDNAGFSSANKFLFGIPSSTNDKVLSASQVINSFRSRCGAKNPSIINGTNMRKHLATHCVTQKLNDPDVADVCDFMGHAELVHRKVYRQNTIERQLVNMSKVLEAAQGNIVQTNTVGEHDVRFRAVRNRKKTTPDQQVKKKSQRVATKKSQRVATKESQVVKVKRQRVGRKSKK